MAATPAMADRCIRHNDLWNWQAVNNKTIILENTRHQKWLVKLIGTCDDLNFHQRLAIRSPGASQLDCVERGDTVITHEIGFRGVCAITSIEPYTPPANQSHPDNASPKPLHPSY